MARVRTTALQRFILIALAIILAVVIVAVSVYFANADRKQGRPGDVSSIIEQPGVLNTSTVNLVPGYAFNVNDNLAVCNRKVVRVALNFSIQDYSPKINKAVADISRDGGGSVMLDEGVYYLSTPIFPKNNTCIRGAGMLKTLIRMNPNSPPFYRAGMMRIDNASRVSIHDLTLDGSRATQINSTTEYRYGRYGLYATRFEYLWLRGIRAVNHREYGFDPHGTRETWSHYLVIESCDASENGLDGFTIDQTEHVSLLRSTARHNYRHGVNIVTGSRDVLVRDVTADYNGASYPNSRGCGLIAQNNVQELQTQDIKIVSSTFSESPRGAVCISDSVNVSLSNVNATVTRFLRTPCFVLRQARQVNFSQTTCTARSGRRISNIESMFIDDMQGQATHWRPTNPLEFSSQHSMNTWVPETDPVCSYGMSHKNICCPYDCDVCGKPGCGVYGQADRCCMDKILESKKYCSDKTAPCVIKEKYMPLPDVFIDIPYALAPGKKSEDPKGSLSPQEIDASKNEKALPPGGMGKPIDQDAGKRSNDTIYIELPADKKDSAVAVSEDRGKSVNRTIVIDLPHAVNVSESLSETKKDEKDEFNRTVINGQEFAFVEAPNGTTIMVPVFNGYEEDKKADKSSDKDAKEDEKEDEKDDEKDDEKKDKKEDTKKDDKEDAKDDTKKESVTSAPKVSSATDPVCDFGISYKNVCCPYECSVCGQEGCGKKGQAHYCCMDAIVDTKKSCSDSSAPCVVDKDYLPLPKGKNSTNEKIFKEFMDDEVEEIIVDDEGKNDLIKDFEKADPLCKGGTSFKNVCCAKDCKVCGDEGCGKNGQGGRCCLEGIMKSKKSCSEFSAPCVFESKYKDNDMKEDKKDIKIEDTNANATKPDDTPAADPTCKWGTPFKNVCCPYDCGDVCGKVGCGVDGQAGRCCLDGIIESKNSCSGNIAPCIMEPNAKNTTDAAKVAPKKSEKSMSDNGDPVCEKGFVYKNVCCPKDCDVCAKAGCGVAGLAGRCCMDTIIEADKSCNENEAPCVLDKEFLPLPKGEKNTTLFKNADANGDNDNDKNNTMVNQKEDGAEDTTKNGTETQKEKIVQVFVNELSQKDKEAQGRSVEFGLDSDGKLSDDVDVDMDGKEVYVDGKKEE